MTCKLEIKLINHAIQSVISLEVLFVIKNKQHKNILQEVKTNNLKSWNGKFTKSLKELKIRRIEIPNLTKDMKVLLIQLKTGYSTILMVKKYD